MDSAARLADATKAKGAGDGRVVSVIDARGAGLANLDPEASKLVVEVAQVKKRRRKRGSGVFFLPSLSLSPFSHSYALPDTKKKKRVQDHYPERSLTTFIFGAPSAFAAIVQLLLPLISPSSRGKVKFVKAGGDWAAAAAAAAVDAASLPRVLGGTGPDAVPVQVAARAVGILRELPVPAVDEPWGVVAADAEASEAEKEKKGKEEAPASASASASASAAHAAAAAAAAAAEGKTTEQERSGVVSLTATAAL